MNPDFDSAVKKFWERFDKGIEVVLATSAGNDVTARTVSATSMDGKVYFLTFEGSTKLAQIRQNANVAMCRFDLYLRGTAKISGDPREKENASICSALRDAFPDDMEAFGRNPGARIVEVHPSVGGFGRMSTGGMFVLDFEEKSVSQIRGSD